MYRGYMIRIGSPRKDGRLVQIWKDGEMIERATSVDHAERIIDGYFETAR